MSHDPNSHRIQNISPFSTALHLIPTVEAVAKYNVAHLQASGKFTATIKAVHTRPNATSASANDAGGLEAVITLEKVVIDVGLNFVTCMFLRGGVKSHNLIR